jgi:hypothetical protein
MNGEKKKGGEGREGERKGKGGRVGILLVPVALIPGCRQGTLRLWPSVVLAGLVSGFLLHQVLCAGKMEALLQTCTPQVTTRKQTFTEALCLAGDQFLSISRPETPVESSSAEGGQANKSTTVHRCLH